MPRTTLTSTQRELGFPGNLKVGDRGTSVKRLQEWLAIHGVLKGPVDQEFGNGTADAVSAFRKAQALAAVGPLDQSTWDVLIAPLRKADAFVPTGAGAREAVVETARAHLDQGPVEIGGENCGPWVRYYTHGNDGAPWQWCQGFASSVFQQAFETLGKALPFPTTDKHGAWCLNVPAFARIVEDHEGLVSGSHPNLEEMIHPGAFYFIRGGDAGYEHSGLVESINHDNRTFVTINGNWGNKIGRATFKIGPGYDFGVFRT